MSCAENVTGLKFDTEDRVPPTLRRGEVEEYSIHSEAVLVRDGGVYRSKNVGMSSIKAGENPAHRKPKVSWATQIDPGLVGPKARPV